MKMQVSNQSKERIKGLMMMVRQHSLAVLNPKPYTLTCR